MPKVSKATLINAVLFQGAWFACVIGGAAQLFWPGVAMVFLLILSVANAPSVRHDVLLAVLLVPCGWLLDTGWIATGILDYHGQTVAPSWIVLMWLAVALTINHSLAFFRDHARLGALAVLFAAPLSYLAGERLGAVIVPQPALLMVVSVAWSVLFYLVFSLSHQRVASWSEQPVR